MMTMGNSLKQGKEDGIKTAENRHSIFLEEFGFERDCHRICIYTSEGDVGGYA